MFHTGLLHRPEINHGGNAMRLKSLIRRRPSASLVISAIALFVALGGASYAAVSIPANSVGNSQLKKGAVSTSKVKNNAITYKKVAQHTIGLKRVDNSKIQTRVSGTCSGNSAIDTITQGGKVTCHSTLPPEFGASSDSTAVPTTSTTVVSKLLPGGNYLLNANVYATVSGGAAGQQVSITCTLQVASGSSQTRTVTADVGSASVTEQVALPLTFPAAVASPQGTGHVDCAHTASNPATPDPTVKAISTLNAIATSSNS
jgi:hypothetical protein